MNSKEISEWLAPLSVLEQARAMTLLYFYLTLGARQFFVPGLANGREQDVIDLLHGINNLHHTIANRAMSLSLDQHERRPDVFAKQLVKIADDYGLEVLLRQIVFVARYGASGTGGIDFRQTGDNTVPMTAEPGLPPR